MDSVSNQLNNVDLNTSGSDPGKILSFQGKSYKLDSADDAQKILDEMTKESGSISTLEFSGNTIGIEAAKAIGKTLEKFISLERCLWSDMFTGRLKTEIAPALEHLSDGIKMAGTRLVEIDLSDNAFGPNGIVGITGLLAHEACFSLKILRLNNNGLGHQGCRHLVDALKSGLSSSNAAGRPMRLTIFNASRNRLENVGAGLLSEVFREMGSLEELALPQNGIGIHGSQGVEDLVEALESNSSLRILNLSDNSIKPSGARLVAKLLPNLPNLEVLNLSDCILRSSGAQSLAEVLMEEEVVPQLVDINLSGNEINASSAVELALSMLNKSQLKSLDLNCNEIGESGISNLMEALKSVDKEDALTSLSEDEGTASEDEEEEEDHVDTEEEDEAEEKQDPKSLFGGVPSKDSEKKSPNKNLFGDSKLQQNPFSHSTNIQFSFKQGLNDSCDTNSTQFTSLFSGVNTGSGSTKFPLFPSSSTTAETKVIQLTLDEVMKEFEMGDPQNLIKIFVDVLKKFEKSSCWSAISTNAGSDQLNDVIKKAINHTQVKHKLIQEVESTTRLAYKLCYLEDMNRIETSASKTLLAFVLKYEPRLAANSVLVELGLIKSEEKNYKPQAIVDSKHFSKALRFTRIVLSDKLLDLSPDVANTLVTILKNQPEGILEKNELWSKLSPNKEKPSSGKGESTCSGGELTDDFEALLNTIETKVSGLSLNLGTISGDKQA